ncbi:MAG TPA: PepSY domain-containing protein [Tepidisphaeraceae bacterium]|nr:PepSY domain-containing protein [Tepidisphaeraceae bacterium]
MFKNHLIVAAAGAALFTGALAWTASAATLSGHSAVRALDAQGKNEDKDEKEQKIAVADVPQKVTDAVKAAYKGATITGAEKKTEDDKTAYELHLTAGGASYEVTVDDAGTILKQEEKIAANDLPPKVADAVKAAFPQGTITSAEKVTKGDKVRYEVHVTSGTDKYEMKIDLDGKVLKQKLEDKDDND